MAAPRIVSVILGLVSLLASQVCFGQWQKVDGLRGRSTYTLTSSGPALYSLVEGNAVAEYYRSMDSGQTWVHLPQISAPNRLTRLYAQDSFVAVLRDGPSSSSPTELLVSHDFGTTFTSSFYDEDEEPYFNPGAVAFKDEKIYLTGYSPDPNVTGHITIKSSTDLGATWNTDVTNITSTPYLRSVYLYGSYLFATGSGSSALHDVLYRSHLVTGALDSVYIYNRASPNEPPHFTHDGSHLYLGTGSSILRSSDTGATWDTLTQAGHRFYYADGYYYFGNAIVNASGEYSKSALIGDWRSITDFAIQGNYWLAATEAGIYRSPIGKNEWSMVDTQMVSKYASRLQMIGNVLTVMTESGLHYSTDKGDNWRRVDIPMMRNYERSILSGITGNLYNSGGGLIWRSTDTGRTWAQTGLPKNSGSHQGIVFKNNVVVLGARDGVHRSTTNGETWTTYLRDNFNFPLYDAGSIIYATDHSSPIERTTDMGKSWRVGTDPMLYSTLKRVEADGQNVFVIHTSLYRGDTVYRSTNAGVSWKEMKIDASGITAMHVKGDRVLIARGTRLDSSSNLGTSWSTLPDTVPAPVGEFLLLDNYLFASTGNNGLFRMELKAKADVIHREAKLEPIEIAQAISGDQIWLYHNEALDLLQHIEDLSVIDIMGRSQKVKIDKADSRSLELNTSQLRSGVYFLSYLIDGERYTHRFMVQR